MYVEKDVHILFFIIISLPCVIAKLLLYTLDIHDAKFKMGSFAISTARTHKIQPSEIGHFCTANGQLWPTFVVYQLWLKHELDVYSQHD